MRRAFVIMLLLLIGGAVVNVGVAWWIGATLDAQMRDCPSRYGKRDVSQYGLPGADFWNWHVARQLAPTYCRTTSTWSDYDSPTKAVFYSGTPPTDFAEEFVPEWAPELSPEANKECHADHSIIAWEYGWPKICVGGFAHIKRQQSQPLTIQTTCAIVLEPKLLPDINFCRNAHMLVYKPLWPGFAINTLFFASALGLLIVPMFAVRLVRQVRRRCMKCGYPVGVSAVCTECGAEVK
jgi:hypothetical protein